MNANNARDTMIYPESVNGLGRYFDLTFAICQKFKAAIIEYNYFCLKMKRLQSRLIKNVQY